ncbi:MAG TPA: GAF domain-containing protein [Anaerolineae bacterium]|nr:GAF domain-containing protein [Anaerolineae bacterium]
MRVIVLVALPMLVAGVYYTYLTREFVLLTVAIVGYLTVALVAFAPRIPYTLRVWVLLIALLVLGAGDLLTYGWGEDGRIYLLTAILFATIFLGGRQSFAVFVTSTLILVAFVGLVSFRVIEISQHPGAIYTPDLLVSGLIVYLVCATALYMAFSTLFPRIFASLQRSAQISEELEGRQAALAERMSALQEANLSIQRRAMYLDATTRVVQALIAVFDVESLLDQAVQLISHHFEAAYVAIYTPDETDAWLVLRAASSSAGRRLVPQGYRLKRDEQSVIARVAETQRPHIARPTSDLPMDKEHFVTNPDPTTTRAAAILPLLLSGEVLGVLDIHTAETDFDQDDLHILQGLAWQLAIALDNARRLSAAASILETANPFYRLAGQLSATRTATDVYAALLGIVQGFNPAQAYVVQAARETDARHLVADRRGDQLNMQYVDREAEDFNVALAIGEALQAPLFIVDVTTVSALPLPGFRDFCTYLLERSEQRSVALIPLRVQGRFWGLLMVTYSTAHQFTPLEMQLYRVIGDLTSVTLERIAVVQEAQRQLEQERWLREFGERVIRTPDLEAMLVQAAQALQDIARADGVRATLVTPADGK